MEQVQFRRIERNDNEALAAIIREVLVAHGVPKTNSTYEDESLDDMFTFYSEENAVYWVLEKEGRIVGGGGIAPLEGGDKRTCELQKMYFLPAARGQGLGSRLLRLLLEEAKELGYRECYLETVPQMEAARRLYAHFGFKILDAPKGNTGHGACAVWMIKELKD